MSAPPDAVMQAILALCEHAEAYHPDCPQCLFRAEAAAEHLKHVIQETIDSLNSKDGMSDFTVHFTSGQKLDIKGWTENDSKNLVAALQNPPDGSSTITKADGTGWIINRAHIAYVEIRKAS